MYLNKMKKTTIFVFIEIGIFILSVLIGCRNNSNRESIQFQDSLINIENSIQELNNIMDNFVSDKVTNYYFDSDGYLYINSVKMFLPNEDENMNSIDSSKIFVKLNPNEIKNF